MRFVSRPSRRCPRSRSGVAAARRPSPPGAIGKDQLSQLAWAAQGITDDAHGLRAAPSAGALYPLELYVVDGDATWHYEPAGHRLVRVATGDRRAELGRAALDQDAVKTAGAAFVITGVVARTRAKYGARAERYVAIEAGHAAQNVLLEATALGLAAVPVGAFDDDAVMRIIGAAREETPLYIVCVGLERR